MPCLLWGKQEFGDAELGDSRRTSRLVAMAGACAAHPAGKVTEVFRNDAEREGAYRFLENDQVPVSQMAAAAHRAGAQRCIGQPYVYVPIDGSSLHIEDPEDQKRLGIVGAFAKGARGLCVMTAIAILTGGTPAGLVGQCFWARKKKVRRKKRDRRKTAKKETRYWLDVMGQARQAFAQRAPEVKPWFQLDAGGDAWPVLWDAVNQGDLLTVRAAQDRRLLGRIEGKSERLWPYFSRQEPGGYYTLEVAEGKNRQARMAWMQIQWAKVELDLVDQSTGKHRKAGMWAVRAVEVDTTPPEEEPIEWMLLTTYEVKCLEDAQRVLEGYAARWRVEEFHKAWKSGVCHVEETQLGDREHIERWATILASVAMRAVRLSYLGRTDPKAPATLELTRAEIDALILQREPKGIEVGETPTMEQAVRWLSDLGGYTGKSSGGPPGMIVLMRGLRSIEGLARVLARGIDARSLRRVEPNDPGLTDGDKM